MNPTNHTEIRMDAEFWNTTDDGNYLFFLVFTVGWVSQIQNVGDKSGTD